MRPSLAERSVRLKYVMIFAALMVVVVTAYSACGLSVRGNLSDPKIVGGRAARYYPFFVQLLANNKSPTGFCGGSLIAPRVVITAAHCIYPEIANEMYVAMGIDNGTSLHLTHPVKVIGIVRHPDFTGTAEHGNDVALLYLDRYSDVQFRNRVSPALRDNLGSVRDHENLRIVGLGSLSSLGMVDTDVIREADVQVVSQSTCSKTYPLNNMQLCAGDYTKGGRDSCHGDSGGPLLRVNGSSAVSLVGLVSYGHGCGQKGQPGVYTKVASYKSWIDAQIIRFQTELDSNRPATELKDLISTRCLGQVNGLVERFAQNGNARNTVWRVDDNGVSYAQTANPVSGLTLASCLFKDRSGNDVQVKWIRLVNNKTSVVAVAQTRDRKFYQSKPMGLKYLADTLSCSTARGKAVLYDTRDESYVSFNDRMYRFGDPVSDPGDNQTTWGCVIGDAALEVFESEQHSRQLAVRIHHPSLGTIVRLLETGEQLPDKMLQASLVVKELNTHFSATVLRLRNVGAEDLFSWQLECREPFELILKNGSHLTAKTRESGNGYRVLVEETAYLEGTLRSKQNLDVAVHFSGSPTGGFGCYVNRMFQVLDP